MSKKRAAIEPGSLNPTRLSDPTFHTLTIHSLYDADAECSCGLWEYKRAGNATLSEVKEIFSKHVDYCTGLQTKSNTVPVSKSWTVAALTFALEQVVLATEPYHKNDAAGRPWLKRALAYIQEAPNPPDRNPAECPNYKVLIAARNFVRGRHSTLSYGPQSLLDQLDAAIDAHQAKIDAYNAAHGGEDEAEQARR